MHFKEILQAKIEQMVARSEFFKVTKWDVLEQVLGLDGRWKSQFETNTSEAMLNPRGRAKAEMNMFAF